MSHENPIADINVEDRDGDVQVDGLGDLGDDALNLGMDDQGHLGLDLGLDAPMEPGVGPEIPEDELGPDGMLDVELHVDPHPAEDQLPLDMEVDGHEIPLDGLTEDHNDPALGLDEIEGEGEGDYDGFSPHSHPHPHDGVVDDAEPVDDMEYGGEHQMDDASLLGHEPDMNDDAGLEGLIVMDDGKNSAMGSL